MLPVVPNAEAMDEAKWRKRAGLEPHTPVFAADEPGFYKDVRAALLARGWREAPFGSTPHWTMLLTLKAHAIPHASLRPGQSANHFLGASAFCTKNGLLRCLEGAQGVIAAPPSRFSPRTYDLDEPSGYQAFVDEFRAVAAESVVREAVHCALAGALAAGALAPGVLLGASGAGAGAGAGAAPPPSAAALEELLQTFLTLEGAGGVREAWDAILASPALAAFLASPAQGSPRLNLGLLAAALRVTQRRCRDWDADEPPAAAAAAAAAAAEDVPLVTDAEWLALRYCSLRLPGGAEAQAGATLARERAERESASAELRETDRQLSQLLRQEDGQAACALLAKAGEGSSAEGGAAAAAPTPAPAPAPAPVPAPAHTATGGGRRAVLTMRRGSSLPPPAAAGAAAATPRASPGANLVLAQLAAWRDRAVRDAPSPALAAAAHSALSPSIGHPPLPAAPAGGGGSSSSSSSSAFAALAPLPLPTLAAAVASLLALNASEDAQAGLNASPSPNVWIVKPSGKSRGRGIMCENSLHRLLHRGGGSEAGSASSSSLGTGSAVGGGCIAQKYIERPLLIHRRKFDVRQWVTVTSWAPLCVWMYSECYARFCSWPFSLASAASNRYAHLSNNSVQKHTVAFEASGIEGNMWDCRALRAWLEGARAAGQWDGLTYAPLADEGRGVGFEYGGGAEAAGAAGAQAQRLPVSGCSDVWRQVCLPQIRRIVTWTLLSALDAMCDKPGAACCWEQYGFDVMLDAGLKAWLIEVNSTPDMLYSTAVTERMVKEASEGMVALVVDGAAKAAVAGGGGSSSRRSAGGGGGGGGADAAPLSAIPPVGGWECIYRGSAAGMASTGLHASAAGGLALSGKAMAVPHHSSHSQLHQGGAGAQGSSSEAQQRNSAGGAATAAAAAARRAPSADSGGRGAGAAALPPLSQQPPRALRAAAARDNQPKAFLALKQASVDFLPPPRPAVQQRGAGGGGGSSGGRSASTGRQ